MVTGSSGVTEKMTDCLVTGSGGVEAGGANVHDPGERTTKIRDGEPKAHEKSMESIFAHVGGNREHEEDGTGNAASDVLRDLP
jgi:hypothetical protein